MKDVKDFQLQKIVINLQGIQDHPNPHEILEREQEKVDEIIKKIQRRKMIKTVSIVLAGVAVFFLSEYTVIALINFLFYSNNRASVLQPHINEWIPENFSVNDVLTHEVFYPAWNINTKTPIFFSKITNQKYKDTEKVYDISLRDMVWASATNPNFFGSA